MNFKLIPLIIFGLLSANAGAQTVVTDGSLPLCTSGKVAQMTTGAVNSNPATPWTFYSCFGGPKSLNAGIKSITFIDATGTRLSVYSKTISTESDYVDIVAQPLDIFKDKALASLIPSGGFTVAAIEMVTDNKFKINGKASLTDNYGHSYTGARVCGTAASASGNTFTYSNPLYNGQGTMNGHPMHFYQKNSLNPNALDNGSNPVTQNAVWFRVDALPFVPVGYTVNAKMWYVDSGSRRDGMYSSDVTGTLLESDSPYVSTVRMQLMDGSDNLAGYDWSLGGATTTQIKITNTLRTPLVLKQTSKFNIDMKLDLSKMLAWAFYWTNNVANGPGVDSGLSCQALYVGPMILDIKKAAKKDD